MLPDAFEKIARQLADFDKRLESLERLQAPSLRRIGDPQVLTVGAASVTFSNIPQTFAHLLLLYYARGDRVNVAEILGIRFNGDSGNNYDSLNSQERDPAALFTAETLAGSFARMGLFAAASATANVFNGGMVRIPHYTNTVGQKSLHSLFDYKFGILTTEVRNGQAGGYWRNTAAITSLTALAVNANFIAGSRFDLYGIA